MHPRHCNGEQNGCFGEEDSYCVDRPSSQLEVRHPFLLRWVRGGHGGGDVKLFVSAFV